MVTKSDPGIFKSDANSDEIFARKCRDNEGNVRWQTLQEHSGAVARLAASFAESFGGSKLSYEAGLYHDDVKASSAFQGYLLDDNAQRGSVQHSLSSAKRIYDLLCEEYLPLAELIANVIAAHHGHLYDFIGPDGSTPLFEKLIECSYQEDDQEDISLDKIDAEVLLSELRVILNSIHPKENKLFALSLFIKLIYSCLVDADRLDAYLFETQQTYEDFLAAESPKPDWGEQLNKLEEYLSKFAIDSDMAALRQNFSQQCADNGLRERGVYKLEAPTGGGKTLSSLRFALVHAKRHNLDRIIYVIPYLSILNQTANAIREALSVNDEVVLEHHSDILPDDFEHYKLHIGRWDKPIILTSQVQFMESIFSSRGSDLRKLHSLANSVLVFDEVQSLPVNCIHLFNSAINFFHSVCNSTILLCTATQPLLDKVNKPIMFSENPLIAKCDMAYNRTRIVNSLLPAGYTYSDLAAFVQSKHKTSTLVIVNTRLAAKLLFNELENMGLPVMHLSKSMCSAHSNAVIKEIRQKLAKREPVICISTQLIEAGVDISFECVIRDIAGLDSIWQAAGRCNRHGEFEETKPVYVVNIASEDLDRLQDIKIGVEIAQRLFREGKLDDINEYYEYYFFKRSSCMDYPVYGGTVYDFLSENQQGCKTYRNTGNTRKLELSSAIRTASKEFYVIAPGQHEVVVPYDKSEEMFQRYLTTDNIKEKSKLLRQLGRYSISLYEFQYNMLEEKGALAPEQKGITFLSKGFYNEKTGIDLEDGRHEFLNV